MSMWHEAADMATEAFNDIERAGDEPSPDQKLALAQIYATLSVSQELSAMIEDKGLSVRIEDKPPSEQFDEPRTPMTMLQAPKDRRIPTRSTKR